MFFKLRNKKSLALIRSRFFKIVYFFIGINLIILFIINYQSTRERILYNFDQEFQKKVDALDQTMQMTIDHVYNMGDLSSIYLSLDSPWNYSADILRENSNYIEEKSTHLYKQGSFISHHRIESAIFVQNPIPESSSQYGRNINLALSLQDVQQVEHNRNSSITLSYFFGIRDYFSQIFPYIPIEDIILHYKDCKDMMDHGYQVYSELAPPEYNPEGIHFWTKPYLDTTQQGMMVSCGIPVYHDNAYVGLVGTDIKLDFLQQYTDPMIEIKGKVLLVSPYDQIITQTGMRYETEEDILFFSDEYPGSNILQKASDQHQFETLPNGIWLYRKDLRNTPWNVIYASTKTDIQQAILNDQLTTYVLGILFLFFLPISYLIIKKKFILPGIKADEDLRHLNKDLDTIINQRTAELEEKNKELENYLYVASHDLRSPLVNIQGFSLRFQKQMDKMIELIEPNQNNPEIIKIQSQDIPKTLKFIQTNVLKMDSLLNGLLTISRTGRTKMAPMVVSGAKIFDSVLDSFEHQLTDINAKVIKENIPDCYGDWDLLNQLFSNIISNSIKYHSVKRPLEIKITGENMDHYTIYTITDNGIGIANQHISRIFDVFFRVDFSKPETGDGIGLSIVKRIVDMHRGKINVVSQIDIGTTLYIELPNESKTFNKMR